MSEENGFSRRIEEELRSLREAGLYKKEQGRTTAQGARVGLDDGEAINLCSNNYLGLGGNPEVMAAAIEALEKWGFGLASVRFICGTQLPHQTLERELAGFLNKEAAILFGSCWDANAALFETLLDAEDAVFSDQLNHASIIDGIRLCKARRYRFPHKDLEALEQQLVEARDCRTRLIATDGVFSMDGDMADLAGLARLAEKHEALLMVDDSHGTGVLGSGGRGTPELCGVESKVDLLTGTLGKALGGASGGYLAASRQVCDLMRQRARPYLFSNTLAPAVVGGSLKALELARTDPSLRERLHGNAKYLRAGLSRLGLRLLPGEHPIIPVMIGDAKEASEMAAALLRQHIYAVAFSYPVVPKNEARIRLQASAAHTRSDLDQVLAAFRKVTQKE